MIKLIEKKKIIIAYFQKGKSQRQIAREMGLNRRTITKYIKDYETKKAKLTDSKENSNQEELIADIVEDPRYDTTSRKKVKLTDEIIILKVPVKNIYLYPLTKGFREALSQRVNGKEGRKMGGDR